MELISEQVLIAMSEMGLDRERTIQVGCVVFVSRTVQRSGPTSAWEPFSFAVLANRRLRSLQRHLQSAGGPPQETQDSACCPADAPPH